MRRTTGPPYNVEDLREKLNRKRQERAEQNATCDTTADWKRKGQRPPPDPVSFLRDPLRGDEITKDMQADNNGQRLRGHRGRGGHKPMGPKTKPLNIIVEFSNPGERTCTIDESLEGHSPIRSKQGIGHYRGHRNFRGPPRNRGSYSSRNRENKVSVSYDFNENFKSQEVDKRWNKSEKYKVVPSIETTEDWTTDETQGAMNNKSKDWIPSVKTTEDGTTDEFKEVVSEKSKNGIPSIKTTQDWTADECRGAVSDKSKDEIPSLQTTEDWTTDEFNAVVSEKSKDGIPSIKTADDWTADECLGAVSDKSNDEIPSIQTTEDWTTDEFKEVVSEKSKDGIPSIKTTEDWTADECPRAVNNKSKDEIPSKQTTKDWTTDEFKAAVSEKSKDEIPSIKTTEDWTPDEYQGVNDDNSKDSNDEYELAQVPNENAEVFSPNLEEDSNEEKVGKKKEEKVKEVDYKAKPA